MDFDAGLTSPVHNTATSFNNSSSEALDFYSVCMQVFLKGGFKLQKWESNNVTLKTNIKEKEAHNCIVNSNPSTNDPQFRKVLGMNLVVVRGKFQF